MKHKGCTMHFIRLRNLELLATYHKVLEQKEFIDITQVAEAIINSPASRFWVSEDRAFAIISAMTKGRPVLATMNPAKREMFQEIFNRVTRLSHQHPDAALSDLVFQVVNSPAPKFYYQPRTVIEYIRHAIKYNKKKTLYHKKDSTPIPPSSLSQP